MIQNKQHNQVMITDTKHYVNLQDMLLAVVNIITKSNPDTQRYNVGVEFTNFPNAKLDNLYGEHCYECRSCHLSRKLCIEKGFATDVPDIFDAVFGDDYVCELHSETNFADAMTRINDYRQNLAKKADKLVILNNENIGNVALELEMFTQNRVMIL